MRVDAAFIEPRCIICAVCESLGLRRALQVAHADSLLMSMCAVPDSETQELMTMLHKEWPKDFRPSSEIRRELSAATQRQPSAGRPAYLRRRPDCERHDAWTIRFHILGSEQELIQSVVSGKALLLFLSAFISFARFNRISSVRGGSPAFSIDLKTA